jgi:VWFA-related protein
MKKRASLSVFLILNLFLTALGQQPAPRPSQQTTQQQTDEDDVVRITTNLVQVDAVVTDKKGRQVTDLGPEEFEIFEDDKSQKITNLSYVSTESAPNVAPPGAAQASKPADKNAPPVPPRRLRPEQVRRTLALVVDDLSLSFESVHFTRRALKKFVDEQMQPDDLVAIIRTSGGAGALQQFTSDKRQLYAAIERLRWYSSGRGGSSAFAPIDSGPNAQSDAQLGENDEENIARRNPAEELNEFREDLFAVGTLGAISYVVRGLKELPGRKSILLISDGFTLIRQGASENDRVLQALRRLTDLANRASVVIYTMDARGLQTLGLTAADNVSGLTSEEVESSLASRRQQLFDTQSGLIYLAQQTGGFNIRNNNDLSAGIKSVLNDQKGYYLIGYRPEESTFDSQTGRRSFHRIKVRVKRPGLEVRSRTGFFGVTDEERPPSVPRTRAAQLINAINSPFDTSGVDLRLTSLYINDLRAGPLVRSLLYIDASDLTFTDEADGWHKAVFDVLAVTFGENGMVVDEINRTQTLRTRGETYTRLKKYGMVYFLNVPVKKAGAYQLRIAVRDASTERTGSASQFIEVPNLTKNRLTLSGVLVSASPQSSNRTNSSAPTSSAQQAVQNSLAEGASEEIDPRTGASLRQFQSGMIVQYGYVIYNAQLDKSTNRPQLQTQLRLFRDGQLVFTGKVTPYEASSQRDLKRLVAGGALQIGTDLLPGDYVLQVIVTDLLAKEKNRTATQWIDFEIVK